MDFADLLSRDGFAPGEVLVLRHRPWEPRLANIISWIVGQRPDLFKAYQSAQNKRAESSFTRAGFIASFIAQDGNRAAFAGLYKVNGWRHMPLSEFIARPSYSELVELGMMGSTEEDYREDAKWFDLSLTDFCHDWIGKLIIDWPPPPRAWTRWGDRNLFRIHAINEESAFERAMPAWRDLVVSWNELALMPRSWRAALKEWRGIYHIQDVSSGLRYVGSAYGDANLLGRWEGYAATGHGDNRHLKKLDPVNFRFSILERVSPDLGSAEVIEREQSWKLRLNTRHPDGLNGN